MAKYKVGQLLYCDLPWCWELIKIAGVSHLTGRYDYFCIDESDESYGVATNDTFGWIEDKYALIVNCNTIWNDLNG